MKSTSISHLKASLSRYLSLIKGGEEVIITDRGKPIAKIIPLNRGGDFFPERLKELERRGLLRIGSGQISERFWETPRVADRKSLARKALQKDRKESR